MQNGGKYASRFRAKPSGGLCAVLPCIKKKLPRSRGSFVLCSCRLYAAFSADDVHSCFCGCALFECTLTLMMQLDLLVVFLLVKVQDAVNELPAIEKLEIADKWVLSKLNTLIAEVTENMDKYELGVAVQKVYDFIWDEFCDWYIEMVKPRLYNSDDQESKSAALWTLKTVLIDALKLLHPYMPFITEEIFCTLQSEEESIMISKWPEYKDEWNFAKEEADIEIIKEAVRGIRNVRTEMNVAPSRKALVYVVSENEDISNAFTEGKLFFASLAYASDVMIQKDKSGIAEDAVSVVIANATLYIPFAELVDLSQEIERLEKEEKKLQGELARVNGMLNNEKFMSKAPEAKVAEERAKLEKYTQMMEQVKERLAQLKK